MLIGGFPIRKCLGVMAERSDESLLSAYIGLELRQASCIEASPIPHMLESALRLFNVNET